MSSIKHNLKAAKKAIEANDPESVLEYVEEIVELDPKNYFAYIFRGKAYQLLNDLPNALRAFEVATELEPDNMLGWKGYFQVARMGNDYQLFFRVLTQVISLQIDQGIGIGETLKDMKNYLDLHGYKSNSELYQLYLTSIIPSSPLGQLVGNELGNPESNLVNLIESISKSLHDTNQKIISKERVKFGRNLTPDQKFQLNNITYKIYKDSALESLYIELLNISNNEEIRMKYQEEYLKFKYDIVLKGSPNKQQTILEIKDMIEGMVLIKTKCLFAWNLYFDWLDPKTIGDIPIENIIFYLNSFPTEGLGQILYGYILSDISQFDKQKIIKETSKAFQPKAVDTPSTDDDESLETNEDVPTELQDEAVELTASPDQVLSLMLEGFAKSKTSVLVNRIICNYYIHIREYGQGSANCHDSIRLLADIQRNIGLDLENTREDLLCSLAIIYTYYEAPKNFLRALQLYDRILETNKDNVKAKLGKGLILMEKDDLENAMKLLSEVVEEYPDNYEAKNEYSWCLIKLHQFEAGRKGLETVLENMKGGNIHIGDIRSTVHWRIAKSFLMENDTNPENIKEAYTHLIKSLKENQNHASSYTLLGVIYRKYYNDNARATKCFYKAFELDVNEIIAAKYLVEDLTASNEWDVAEILCMKVITSESSRRILLSKNYEDADKSWPYRVLGCSCLNKQDDAKAVEWFQTALRMASMDVQCWIGLGEAYFNCGRLDAAAKVFRHTLTLGENTWIVIYMLGKVLCEIAEFEEGLSKLLEALAIQANEECILSAIYEGYMAYTLVLIQQGFIGRALEANINALRYIRLTQKVNASSQTLWKSINECLRIYLVIQDKFENFPIDILKEIFSEIDLTSGNDLVVDINADDKESTLQSAITFSEEGEYTQLVLTFMILSSKAGIKYLPSKVHKFVRSIAFYNLGLSYLEAFHRNDDNDTYKLLSIKYLKKAIQLENNNASFWLALGNAYISHNPQISQHCFIKAITLESRDAGIWTNLAALYLRYGDTELAQQAFLRAQSVAPHQSQSWLGYALSAEASGDEELASRLFTHAYIVSNGRSPLAQLLYGLSIIKKRNEDTDPRNIEAAQEFSVANFAMQKYLQYLPKDEFGLTVALTVSERCKNYESARGIGERLCELFEKQYEKTESEVILVKFAKAKTQLARIYLALDLFEEALEAAEYALNICDEDKSITLSSRIVIGLGLFFQGKFDESLEILQKILATHSESSRMVCLIAQVLNEYGSDDTKQAALDQLFSFIEEHGSNLLVVLVLGAISVVDNLEDYFVAIKDELRGLSLQDTVNDSVKVVPKLLSEINTRLNTKEAIWERQAVLFPSEYNVWVKVNNSMAIAIGELRESKVTTEQLSQVYYQSGSLRNIQRSLFLNAGNEAIQQTLCIE